MRRWLTRAVVVAAVLAVAVAGGVVFLLTRDTETPVDVAEAVDRYREEGRDVAPGTTGEAPRPIPAEGVYVYATEGEDRIDILGGSTHTYPAETTVTIRHTGCGFVQRWAPLDQRWDEEEVCVAGADRERRTLRAHHAFFGISDDQAFRCEAGYVLFRADPEIGDTWSTSCESDDTRLTGTAEVVGFEERVVSGEQLETVHLRVTEQAAGGDDGPSSDDYWFRRDDGLLVERSSTVETRSDSPVGTATYTERFTLRLVSLRPRT